MKMRRIRLSDNANLGKDASCVFSYHISGGGVVGVDDFEGPIRHVQTCCHTRSL